MLSTRNMRIFMEYDSVFEFPSHDQGLKSIAISVETTKFRGGYHCNGGAD